MFRFLGSPSHSLGMTWLDARQCGATMRKTADSARRPRRRFGGASLPDGAAKPWRTGSSVLRCAMIFRFVVFVFVLSAVIATSLFADEGMWLFNSPPLKRFKEEYQFEPTPQWLEHLQKASVRFNSGGSGSFVSANGLVITNHHVGRNTLQKISDAQHNYLRDGFYAKTQAEEIKSTDLELNVLVSIEDVTARVSAAVKPGMKSDQASSARNAAIAAIEKESKEKTGLRSDVVT